MIQKCLTCKKSLAERRRALREAGFSGVAHHVGTCSKECARLRRNKVNLARYLAGRAKIREAEGATCPGVPKVVAPGLLLPAVPCGKPRGTADITYCRACGAEADRRRARASWALRRGNRTCAGCESSLPIGSRYERVGKYCDSCISQRANVGPRRKAKAKPAAPAKPRVVPPHEKAAMEFDLLRLLQEDHEHGCATREDWATRVGRDPKHPDTDRQWSRMKDRLKAHGYKVEVVEFDAVKDTGGGQTQNYRRWGVKVKR